MDEVIEPADCRMGQLQRGRGAGLADPESARSEVVSCVLQNLGRPAYYGELIARIHCPIEALLALARNEPEDEGSVQVLAEAALRGHADAMLLISDAIEPEESAGMLHYLYGEHPEWLRDHATDRAMLHLAEYLPLLDAEVSLNREYWSPWRTRLSDVWWRWAGKVESRSSRRVIQPCPDLTALSVEQILDLGKEALRSHGEAVLAELASRESESDRARLALQVTTKAESRLAGRALARQGDLRLMRLAEEYLDRGDVGPTGKTLADYVTELPTAIALPLVRAWHPRGGRFRYVASRILEEHAEPGDREWIEAYVDLDTGSGWELLGELDALTRLADPRSAPVLARCAVRATYDWARARALEGLGRMKAEPSARSALTEALWDADEWCREVGCLHAPIEEPGVRERLLAIASDPVEQDQPSMAARSRV